MVENWGRGVSRCVDLTNQGLMLKPILLAKVDILNCQKRGFRTTGSNQFEFHNTCFPGISQLEKAILN